MFEERIAREIAGRSTAVSNVTMALPIGLDGD